MGIDSFPIHPRPRLHSARFLWQETKSVIRCRQLLRLFVEKTKSILRSLPFGPQLSSGTPTFFFSSLFGLWIARSVCASSGCGFWAPSLHHFVAAARCPLFPSVGREASLVACMLTAVTAWCRGISYPPLFATLLCPCLDLFLFSFPFHSPTRDYFHD